MYFQIYMKATWLLDPFHKVVAFKFHINIQKNIQFITIHSQDQCKDKNSYCKMKILEDCTH